MSEDYLSDIIYFTGYDKDGKIIRSGKISDSINDISLIDKESYINFTDSDGNILDSIKLSEEIIEYKNPIFFIDQNYDLLKVHINIFKYGCKSLSYYIKENESITVDIDKPDIELKKMETGIYTFNFYDKENNLMTTVKINIYINNYSDDIKTLTHYINNINSYQEDLINKISTLKDTTLFDAIINSYNNDDTSTDKLSWFKTLNTWQSITNGRIKSLNSYTGSDIEIIDNCFSNISTKNIDEVYIYNKNTNEQVMHIDKLSENKCICLDNEKAYKIVGYKDWNPVTCMYIYVPNTEIRSKLWNDENSTDKSLNTILNTDYIDFSDEELSLALIQENKDPFMSKMSPPTLCDAADNKNIIAVIDDIDYNMIQKMGDVFIVMQETDNVLYPTVERKILITDNRVYIDKSKHYISQDSDYFVWIQDGYGNILSSLYLFSFNDNWEYNEYSNKMRKIYLKNYLSNLNEFMNIDLSQSDINAINSIFNFYIDDIEINESNVFLQLIKDIKSDAKISNVTKSIMCIYKTILSMGNKTNVFFDTPVRYKNEIDTLTFAPKVKSYILNVLKFNLDGDIEEEFIQSSDKSAIDYRIEQKYDYYIFYCIDLLTEFTSGFIIVCNVNKSKTIGSVDLDMEVTKYE